VDTIVHGSAGLDYYAAREGKGLDPAKPLFFATWFPTSTLIHALESDPSEDASPRFDPALFEERFRTIEWLFACEDKFHRLPLFFERVSQLHYAFKTLPIR
jgi:hypothetical protein